MRLASIYRACGSEVDGQIRPGRPPFFDKFKCWKSFYDAFGYSSEVYVVWDGEQNRLSDYINSFDGIHFIKINEKNNQKSLLYCYELAEKLNSFEYYFFIEDDFLHVSYSSAILFDGLKHFPNHFITTFDHLHRYYQNNEDITNGLEQIFAGNLTHWRTCESTVCTIAMHSSIFKLLKDRLKHHCLSGENNSPNDRSFYREMLNKGYRVLNPIPAASTHMIISDMAPIVNWKEISNSIEL